MLAMASQSGLGCEHCETCFWEPRHSRLGKALVAAPDAPEKAAVRRVAVSLAVSAMLLAGVVTPLVLNGMPAGADQVSTLQQRAQYIAGEIQAANAS